MKPTPHVKSSGLDRIIRPVTNGGRSGVETSLEMNLEDIQGIAERMVRKARERVESLDAKARALEENIEAQRLELQQEEDHRRAAVERELLRRQEELQAEVKSLHSEMREKGFAQGQKEGNALGREEGYRKGFEEGHREGREAGFREAQEVEKARWEAELKPLCQTLQGLIKEISAWRSRLLCSVREELLPLSLEIAKKVIKREIQEYPEIVLNNIRRAIDLSFRRTALVVEVHPEDVRLVEMHSPEIVRSFTGLEEVSLKPVEEISRGGCRVVSNFGVVDLSLESQLGIIEQALFRRLGEGDPHEEFAGEHPREDPSALPLERTEENVHPRKAGP